MRLSVLIWYILSPSFVVDIESGFETLTVLCMQWFLCVVFWFFLSPFSFILIFASLSLYLQTSGYHSKPSTVEEVLVIDIKPGWKKGTKITFPEKGNHTRGAAPGDLIFVVDEKPHAVFKRDGNDLILHQKISLVDALTGKTLHIATLDGRDLPVTVSYIVKPGHEMVIENEGMPISKEPGRYGNLRIKFDVKFPSRLTADQKSDLRRVLGRKSY